MNKIGFNLLVWNAVASRDLFSNIEKLKAIGYDGIEFSMGNRDPSAYLEIGQLLKDLGMAATAVNAATPEANPASRDAVIRQAAIDRHKQDIDMASSAGATVLCGPLHSAFAQFTNQQPRRVGDDCDLSGVHVSLLSAVDRLLQIERRLQDSHR